MKLCKFIHLLLLFLFIISCSKNIVKESEIKEKSLNLQMVKDLFQ